LPPLFWWVKIKGVFVNYPLTTQKIQIVVFNMIKKIFSVIFALALCVCSVSPATVFADDATAEKVEKIISGDQDYLVLAVLGAKESNRSFDVTVYDIIGSTGDEEEGAEADIEKVFPNSINVYGIDSYMYIDSDDYSRNPIKGDNVLISIERVNEDNYNVKNGIFLVDSIAREQFRFEIPEVMSGTPEKNELSALWVYVYTNGEIDDITIKKDCIVYSRGEKKEEIDILDTRGIKLVDEFGDPISSEDGAYSELQNGGSASKEVGQSKWKLVSVILVIGLIMGVFFVKFIKKFDKRFE